MMSHGSLLPSHSDRFTSKCIIASDGAARDAVLGFEDCSARVEDISSEELTLSTPYVKRHEQLSPKSWSFYSFSVQPDDYQVVVNVATEKNETCKGQLPFSIAAAHVLTAAALKGLYPLCMRANGCRPVMQVGRAATLGCLPNLASRQAGAMGNGTSDRPGTTTAIGDRTIWRCASMHPRKRGRQARPPCTLACSVQPSPTGGGSPVLGGLNRQVVCGRQRGRCGRMQIHHKHLQVHLPHELQQPRRVHHRGQQHPHLQVLQGPVT